MQLILTIENGPQPDVSGKTWRCGTEGGTLGRNADCDLVLPDPKRYTSSLHAVIEYDQEGFKLTDRSTNGTYHNSPKTLIGKNRSVALDDGDRVFIGDFVLRVDVDEDQDEDAPKASASGTTSQFDSDASGQAFGDDSGGWAEEGNDQGEPWDDGEFSLPWEGDGTEPGATDDSPQAGADDQAQSFSQSPEREYFSAPSASPSGGDAIPDDWDDFLTGFHNLEQMQKPASESDDGPGATPRPDADSDGNRRRGAEDGAHADGDPTPFSAAEPDPEDQFDPPTPESPAIQPNAESKPESKSEQRSEPNPEPPEPASGPEPRPRPRSKPRSRSRPESVPESAPKPRANAPAASQAPRAPAGSGADALAKSGGVPDEEVREILQVVTEGLMSLLQGRAEIKNEFRISQTRFVKTENNPLKFSPDADEALKRILRTTDSPGFLTGKRAFEDALDDIQAHQLAILSAVQRAIESAITQFEPAELEKKLKRISPISAKTPGLKAAKCWSLFTMHYDEVAGKMRDDARQLFLAEFAEAYEEACRAVAERKRKS